MSRPTIFSSQNPILNTSKSYAELDGKNLHFINQNSNSRDFYVEKTFKKVKQDYSHSYIKQNGEKQNFKRQKNRSTANLFSSSCQGYYDTTNSEYKLVNYQSTKSLLSPKKQVSRSISNYNFNSTNSQHKQIYQNQRSQSAYQNNYNNQCNLKSEKTIYEKLLAQKQKNNQDFYVNHPRSNKNIYISKDINYLNSQKMMISLQDISYTNKVNNLEDQLLSQKYYQNSRNYKNYNNNDHIAQLITQQDAKFGNILQQQQIQVQNQLQNLRIMNPIVDYQVMEKKNICDNYNHKKHFKIQDNVSLCLNKSKNQNQSKQYERNKENQSLSQQIIQKQKNSQNWPYDSKINNNLNRSLYKTEKNKTKIDGRNFYIY
ncbi:hypothetical protein PPERSA_04636 [Pseudocohnilembus persalinus]|uniref:Uncharacterized protein n=1 Tax=Pseudocohnilembus persalinus TaxID=266149 RepID=A0A0V0QP11_PSEPJ|nr:hypothetical protein PPERSA_04636 [Pseudocohnilembus persalinus]|eukprot:KRX03841.1 hypothetical protein PPERSA_04636 [Pseudocohnilembus persalinus]